ncbi:unnamed protein product [Psylliodes chrysocephalus]|uniref:Major facilitator superfamily (MFS) profile domain-containing protein n=1 Tax=Psylliodes chrysocephalus TaxID=3402493 RepID=A0A9P0GDG3_9CUCU|nr:unnamed protein product [Psylliodes chrysocephala]
MIEMRKQSGPPGLQEVTYVSNREGEFKPQAADKKRDTLFLHFSIISVCLVVMSGASSQTWSSPVIPKLKSNDTSINPLIEPATTLQISIMMGLPSLTSLFGTFLAPFLSDMFGRKKMLQFCGACMLLCDFIIAFCDHIIYIIIARCILTLFFMGSVSILVILVIEMCESHNRAKFGCFFGFFLSLGTLYSYVFGPMFSVRIFTLVTSIPLIVWIIVSFFTVETPVYLLSKRRTKECLQALQKLRSNKTRNEIQKDFDEIEDSIKQRQSFKNATIFSLFKTKETRVGIGLAMIPTLIHSGCGATVMLSFLGPIFNEAESGLSGNLVAIIVGVLKIFTVFITTIVVENFGRRTLLLFSTLGCALSQLVIGLFFYFKYIDSPITPYIKLFPVIAVVAYFIFYCIGLGPLPPTINSELFTSEFRSVAISILITELNILMFLLTAAFPLLARYVGLHWSFWFFSLFCFIGGAVIYVMLPETSDALILQQKLLELDMVVMKKQSGPPGLQEVTYVTNKEGEFKLQAADKKRDSLFLHFSVISVCLVIMSGASSLAWPSPVIPKLKSNDTSINPLKEPATTLQISMMMGLPTLASLFGTLLAPFLSDMFGRKRMLQLSGACMLLCDVVIAFCNNIIYIIIARCIFMSFFMGNMSILMIFVIELCENHNRAKFGCFFGFFLPLGSLYSYVFGPMFSVRIFTLVTSIPLIFFVIFSFFIVETPVYLLTKGRFKESLQSLRKLRSNKTSNEIQKDFEEIEFSLKQRQSVKNATISSLFKTKESRVGVGVAMIPTLVHCGCGATVVASFLGPIFNEADTGLSGNMVAIIVGILKICTVFITTMVVENFGRRTLLILSSLGCAISQLVIGWFFYLKYIDSPIIPYIKLSPVIAVMVYFIFFNIGLGPLPPTISSELFTSEFRSVAISIIVTVLSLILFLLTSGFPLLARYAGIHWSFWFFSLFCCIGAAVIYVTLPETRGKSIVEIQEELKNYKFSFKSRDTFKSNK